LAKLTRNQAQGSRLANYTIAKQAAAECGQENEALTQSLFKQSLIDEQ